MKTTDLDFISNTFAPGSRGEALANRLVGSESYPSKLAILASAAVHGMDLLDPHNGYWAEDGVTVFLNAAEAVGYGPAITACAKTLLDSGIGKFSPTINIVDPGTVDKGRIVVPPVEAEAQDERLQTLAVEYGDGVMAYVFDEYAVTGQSVKRGTEIVGRAFQHTSALTIRQIDTKDPGDYLDECERPIHRRPEDHALVVNENIIAVQALAADMAAVGTAAAQNMIAYYKTRPQQLDYFTPR